jgi:RES domain-containing protein
VTVRLWRVASDTPAWSADDLSGKGAAVAGARWNHPGEWVTYAATSVSLAAWETRAHVAKGSALPWNRFLVCIQVPDAVWAARTVLSRPPAIGWNAIPEGQVSRQLGSAWLKLGATALLTVPSVLIDEEDNVLINPLHRASAAITAHKLRRFVYDPRI